MVCRCWYERATVCYRQCTGSGRQQTSPWSSTAWAELWCLCTGRCLVSEDTMRLPGKGSGGHVQVGVWRHHAAAWEGLWWPCTGRCPVSEDTMRLPEWPWNEENGHIHKCYPYGPMEQQYNAMQCKPIQYKPIPYNTIQYNAMQCNAMQYIYSGPLEHLFYIWGQRD